MRLYASGRTLLKLCVWHCRAQQLSRTSCRHYPILSALAATAPLLGAARVLGGPCLRYQGPRAVPEICTRRFARLRRRAIQATERFTRVDVTLEDDPWPGHRNELQGVLVDMESSGSQAVEAALKLESLASQPRQTELSIVLCSDEYITELNSEWRQKNTPTDVLSFPMGPVPPGCPIRMLGDIIISIPTAQRQAAERGHSLQDELRILLLHGVLHLLEFDHEADEAGAAAMAAAERDIMQQLGWQGKGLISAAEDQDTPEEAILKPANPLNPLNDVPEPDTQTEHGSLAPGTPAAVERAPKRAKRPDIRLVCLDMDGTLLDSNSKVLPSSIEAIRAAQAKGVQVCLATGKARPAAFEALTPVGLAGMGQLVSYAGPGIFLQGLAVYSRTGSLLPGKNLPLAVVEAAFRWSLEHDMPLAAFLGDDCVTLKQTPELQELHERYYEPYAEVKASIAAILEGPPVKKLLYMTAADIVSAKIIPYWEAEAGRLGAAAMQAVPTMLELVPTGVDKGVGLQQLMKDLDVPKDAIMGVGDGGNDLPLIQGAGLGIAMANAVPAVLDAAAVVVAGNDNDGVAEAIERFVLS